VTVTAAPATARRRENDVADLWSSRPRVGAGWQAWRIVVGLARPCLIVNVVLAAVRGMPLPHRSDTAVRGLLVGRIERRRRAGSDTPA